MENNLTEEWKEKSTFQKSIDNRKKENAPEYIFHDGPPFITGMPHYGHVL